MDINMASTFWKQDPNNEPLGELSTNTFQIVTVFFKYEPDVKAAFYSICNL